MKLQTRISLGVYALAAVLAGALLYHRTHAPIACASEEAIQRLQGTIEPPGLPIENIRQTSGGPFGTISTCAGDVANPMAGTWRPVTYTITRPRAYGPSVIAARMGEATSTQPAKARWWQTVLASE